MEGIDGNILSVRYMYIVMNNFFCGHANLCLMCYGVQVLYSLFDFQASVKDNGK